MTIGASMFNDPFYEFCWDENKNQSNIKKHGIDFIAATYAFADPHALTVVDRIENGEVRWKTIGKVKGNLMVLVAHTVVEGDITVIRIISARPLEPKEIRKFYKQQQM